MTPSNAAPFLPPRASSSSRTTPTRASCLCELLHDEGYDCRTVGSGKAALDVIREFQPHIALLDVGLPEMDGFELARRLRAMPESADMHLVAVTGYGRASDRVASHEAGFDEHLVKPVQPDELLRVLARIQGQSGAADGVSSAAGARDGVAHSGDVGLSYRHYQPPPVLAASSFFSPLSALSPFFFLLLAESAAGALSSARTIDGTESRNEPASRAARMVFMGLSLVGKRPL